MSSRDLMQVALRVLAIFVIAAGFQQAAQLLNVAGFSGTSIDQIVMSGLAFLLGPLLIGGLIWMLAPWLARLGTGDTLTGQQHKVLTSSDLATTAFMVAGVLMIVMALPGLISHLWIMLDQPARVAAGWLIGDLVRILLGTGLVLGRQRILEYALRLGRAGT